jgi:hypothetical protein
MAWTRLAYPRNEVNAAAKALVDYDNTQEFDIEIWQRYVDALPIINNWRSSHSFPLNTFRVGLNRAADRIDSGSLTAQRIKRLSSISLKLQRFPQMKLSQMQDIGGCRAVLRAVDKVRALEQAYKNSQVKHKIDHIDDYILKPKPSGYRGIHIIWRYYSDRQDFYNGLKIEMQLRSTLQHSWATAVETVGTFLQQALKSSLGEEAWLRFFALMGTVGAIKEDTAPVPGTPTDKVQLLAEVAQYANRLDVVNRLAAFQSALRVAENPGLEKAAYFLLEIDPKNERVAVTGFKFGEFERAAARYLEVEKEITSTRNKDAVLVSVQSVAALKRAYPNYFADTEAFVQLVKETLEESNLL